METNAHEGAPLLLQEATGTTGSRDDALPPGIHPRPSNNRTMIIPLLALMSFAAASVALVILQQPHTFNTDKFILRRPSSQSSARPTIPKALLLLEPDSETQNLQMAGLPELQWLSYGGRGVASTSRNGTVLTMAAGQHTARFNPPSPPTWTTGGGFNPAPALVFQAPLNEDWQLSAKITVPNFEHLFDSGCLFGYHNPNDWVNLCFEYSPEQVPEIVSVVTRGVSDDANGAVIEQGNSVYLRLSRFGGSGDQQQPVVYASHWSLDGTVWVMNRHFVLDHAESSSETPLYIGFDAQAPTSESTTALFSDIVFSMTTLLDLRDGS
jgi:regulation of enolase protein 1 (concanavalin A-like superfamily)